MATINWDEMEKAHEEASRPAPAGRYILEVKSLTEGESKGGDPQIKITWSVAEGPYKGKTAVDYLTFNPDKPATISIARNALNMLGVPDLRAWGQIDPQQRTQMFIGKRIEADIEVNEFNGRVTNRIKQKVRAISGSSMGGTVPAGVGTPPPAADAPAPPVNPLSGI